MAWTLTKQNGIVSSWIYETTVEAGNSSDDLKIPAYDLISVTLVPSGGATAEFQFATNVHTDTPEYETDADLSGITAIVTKSAFGIITFGKVVAAGGSVTARVLVR